MITHLFDASAILAHYFRHPGADEANRVLTDTRQHVAITAASLIELKGQLYSASNDVQARSAAEAAYTLYAEQLLNFLPVTRPVTEEAARLLSITGGVLGTAELLAAAAAHLEKAMLVHRNPRFQYLPEHYVLQLAL